MRQLGRRKQVWPPDKLPFPISLGFAHGDGSIVHVGDSAAAFASGSPKQILCIEPVAHFYSLLEENAARLRAAGANIICVNTCVGP
jgi:hypothetical protein